MHVRSALPMTRPVRAVLLVVGLLAALVAAALPAANAAHAAVPDNWGFAFLDNPTPPPGYAPDPSRQWGSWASPASNPVTVNQTGLGSYTVRFPMIGASGGIAHVTAVSSNGAWCQLNSWQQAGEDEDVLVSCYAADGTSANSQFTVVYTTSSGTLPPTAGQYGYLYADASGSLFTEYNSSGAVNSVSKVGTGQWNAWLPGLGQASEAGNLQVTAVDPKQGARCKVTNWAPSASGQNVSVSCYNSSDAPYDTQWTLSYAYQRALYGGSYPPKLYGYLWFNGSVPALTNYNSAGGSNSLSTSGDNAEVILPDVANTPDDAQVTAFGDGPGYCDLTSPWARSGSTATVFVTCYNPGGAPVEAPFFAAYTSAF